MLPKNTSLMYRIIISGFLFLILASESGFGQCEWNWRRPVFPGKVVLCDSTLMIVGQKGIILTSSDGANWTNQNSETEHTLKTAAAYNGKYVVGGTETILTSNGFNAFTEVLSDTDLDIKSICWGNGQFIAVGDGLILSSTYGENWTTALHDTAVTLHSVIYAKDLFVTVGSHDKRIICYTSPDGLSWTKRHVSNFAPPAGLISVAFGDGKFVAVGYKGRNSSSFIIYTSDDAINWSKSFGESDSYGNSVTYGNGTFVAVGRKSFNCGIWVSSDAEAWTNVKPSDLRSLRSIVFHKGTFFALTFQGTLVYSEDGIGWEKRVVSTDLDNCSVAFGNNRFITVGQEGAISSSTDGISWKQEIATSDYHLKNVIHQNDLFLAAGKSHVGYNYGVVLTSPDGAMWTVRYKNNPQSLESIAYGNGTYVAFSWYGDYITSTDGITWSSENQRIDMYIQAAVYGNGRFVAAGKDKNASNKGAIFTSPDTKTWTPKNADAAQTINSICYNSGTFVAVGDSGTILVSSDGDTWKSKGTKNPTILRSVTYGKGHFMIVGNQSKYSSTIVELTSTDGNNWTTIEKERYRKVFSVAYGNDQFVIVGASGMVLSCKAESMPIVQSAFKIKSIGGVRITRTDTRLLVKLPERYLKCNSAKVSLFTVSGKMLHSEYANPDSRILSMPAARLSKGIYILAITIGRNTISTRLVITE